MYLSSVIVLLFLALHNVVSDIVEKEPQPCDGGHCLPKHLCPTGILGQYGVTTLRVDEENECGDFMKICCKKSNGNSCGISNPEGLVYNVESNLTYAKYAEFPWTVAIFETSSSSDNVELTHVGGGTLIHPKYILTAAHTLKKLFRYVARFGEWNMKSNAEIYPARDIKIKEHQRHPLFFDSDETVTPQNDIAVAVLEEKVIYSEHIRPLCLPSAQDVFVGQRCIVTGWGLDTRTEQPASIMKRMEMNVITSKNCELKHRELDDSFRLHRSCLCAEPVTIQNTCFKDGGSPLACQRDDGSYVLAGITSWGEDCDRSNFPGGYVDVAKFISWVQDTMKMYEKVADNSLKYPILVLPVR